MTETSNIRKYEEIGIQIRYFLTWRRIVFGAHLFVLWGAFSGLSKLLENDVSPKIIGILLFIAPSISLCLWIIDLRTRRICNVLNARARIIEDARVGVHSGIEELNPNNLNNKYVFVLHSTGLDLLTYVSINVYIICGSILFKANVFSKSCLFQTATDLKTYLILVLALTFAAIDPFGLKYLIIKKVIRPIKESIAKRRDTNTSKESKIDGNNS